MAWGEKRTALVEVDHEVVKAGDKLGSAVRGFLSYPSTANRDGLEHALVRWEKARGIR